MYEGSFKDHILRTPAFLKLEVYQLCIKVVLKITFYLLQDGYTLSVFLQGPFGPLL